ncbi:MAG TPA: 4Fe-4S dicluster domain-containing protein [Falsiroseomonas sp.]|jgi:molybdopterin-containing oxidoreductase family iron-sulfur binding subunit|nr:4Fe-4S dicluster domain-containing protein [Falsiroseomonas sp.]
MSASEHGRREILRLSAASLALAAAGCDEPTEFGQPLYAPPLGETPDAATYATVLELQGLGRGMLVRTRAGHAVKVDGNGLHPASLGATDVFAEAAVLSLHDPARARRVREGGWTRAPAALDATLAAARADLAARNGAGLRIVTGPVASPTTARLLTALIARWPEARWQQYDPLAEDAALAGAELAFGTPVATWPHLARAQVVLALGADPLGPGPAQLHLARNWALARAEGRRRGVLPSLIVAEASPTLSGAKADRHILLHPRGIEPFGRAVAAALGVPGLQGAASHPEAAAVAAALRSAGSAAVVLAGRAEAPGLHALAHAVNAALGSEVVHHAAPVLARPAPMGAAALRPLVQAMADGAATHVLLLGVNPAYDVPAELGFAAALARVPFSLHAGLYPDETARLCTWQVPLSHELESWGDSRAFDGTAAIRQPATRPLVGAARTVDELLAALLGLEERALPLVQATWREAWGAAFEERWRDALEAGVIPGSAAPRLSLALRPGWDPGPAQQSQAGLVAVFTPDPSTLDGRFAESAWLQELPRPLTKIAWGNAVLLAPSTAAEYGVSAGEEVVIERAGRRVLAPVWPVPWHAPGCITLPLGGGRIASTEVGLGRGLDAQLLRDPDTPWTASHVTMAPTGRRARVIASQLERDFDGPAAARIVAPGEGFPPPAPAPSLYPDWTYEGHAWGMAIDLDTCIGCNACVIACQSENNIPVVGPEQMAMGRRMHWLRVDIYRHGVSAIFQPVPCMHCEKAPCEVVCPVNATVHDHEGLNVMVYPRCIGTRTCSNNCPYKVRRFNWYDYARDETSVKARNPDVPIRPRGVMEKCTYCQHRIAAARSEARMANRPIPDGAVETACQRACPTRAIVFGDASDPDTIVARAKREPRNYALLGELDTRPRTTYLARVQAPG